MAAVERMGTVVGDKVREKAAAGPQSSGQSCSLGSSGRPLI